MSNKLVRSFFFLAIALGVTGFVAAQTSPPANPAPIRYAFSVDWSRERVLSKNKSAAKDTSGATIEAVTTNTYVGHVKVTNRTSVPLQNLEVHIQMHYKAMSGKTQTDEHKDTVKTIPAIRPNETVTVDTDRLELKSSELRGGFQYTDGSPGRQADSIRGAVVTLHHEGKQVFDYYSNPALKSMAASKPAVSTPKSEACDRVSGQGR